jgi:hypothetical protein
LLVTEEDIAAVLLRLEKRIELGSSRKGIRKFSLVCGENLAANPFRPRRFQIFEEIMRTGPRPSPGLDARLGLLQSSPLDPKRDPGFLSQESQNLLLLEKQLASQALRVELPGTHPSRKRGDPDPQKLLNFA